MNWVCLHRGNAQSYAQNTDFPQCFNRHEGVGTTNNSKITGEETLRFIPQNKPLERPQQWQMIPPEHYQFDPMTGERLTRGNSQQYNTTETSATAQGMAHLQQLGLLPEYGLTTAE